MYNSFSTHEIDMSHIPETYSFTPNYCGQHDFNNLFPEVFTPPLNTNQNLNTQTPQTQFYTPPPLSRYTRLRRRTKFLRLGVGVPDLPICVRRNLHLPHLPDQIEGKPLSSVLSLVFLLFCFGLGVTFLFWMLVDTKFAFSPTYEGCEPRAWQNPVFDLVSTIVAGAATFSDDKESAILGLLCQTSIFPSTNLILSKNAFDMWDIFGDIGMNFSSSSMRRILHTAF